MSMTKNAKFLAVPCACAVAITAGLLAGCASKPQEIQMQYVSPLEYREYDCDQISAELHRISHRSSVLYSELDKIASDDQAQMAVGLVLFWPILFALEGGDGPQAAEYARLKGEVEALEKTAIQRKCSMAEFEALHAQEEKAKKAAEAKRKAESRLDLDP